MKSFDRIDVEDAGENFVVVASLFQDLHRLHAAGGVEIRRQLAQAQVRAIVHLHVLRLAGIVVHRNIFEEGNKANFVDRFVVVFDVGVALGGTFVIVEGDAGRDDVDHGGAAMRDGRLENRGKLFLVAGKGAGYKRCSKLQWPAHKYRSPAIH